MKNSIIMQLDNKNVLMLWCITEAYNQVSYQLSYGHHREPQYFAEEVKVSSCNIVSLLELDIPISVSCFVIYMMQLVLVTISLAVNNVLR